MSTLVTLLDEAVARYGERPALLHRPRYRTEVWSYAQLDATSGRIAGWLAGQGVAPGDRMVLWAPNSPAWVAAFFGILRCGAVVVPLDVRSTPDFVARVAEQTEPRLACVSRVTAAGWPGPAPAVALEEIEARAVSSRPPGPPALGEGDPAEIIFTSGTTGDPKGVILTHGNILANVASVNEVVPNSRHLRLLSILPLSHMLEQTVGLLLALRRGASIFYPASRQSTVLFQALQDQQITALLLVPQALQLFMAAIEREVQKQGQERTWQRLQAVAARLPLPARRLLFRRVHRRLGGRLEFFVSGGAPLAPELVTKWEALGIPVLHGYGTTEAAPVVSVASYRHRNPRAVGQAAPGVQVRIASDGEVLVHGANLTPGYWRNPAATAAAFTADGWYRTGDLGRLDAQGYLYLQGRKKDRIVLANGQNVYPEDVEAALQGGPGLADAVVVGLPRAAGAEVHAVLLLDPAGGDPAAIVRAANRRLAAHEQIRGWTVWPEPDLPRTHTLKVKKYEVLRRLAATAGVPDTAEDTGPAPAAADPLLRLVAELAGQPLARLAPTATLGDDLGLDSLGRVELLAAIESELGPYLPEDQVTAGTTIADLQALLGAGQAAPRASFPTWPRAPLARVARAALQTALFAALPLVARLRVRGRGHVRGLGGPALFVANHSSHLDAPVLLRALPPARRRRVAVAAADDYFFQGARPGLGPAVALLLNAFPFSRIGAVRPTLEHCARLVEGGWSLLVFPEGTRSPTGALAPFKSGIGLLAVELGVPVVPVHLAGLFAILPRGASRPHPGPATVHFGRPLHFAPTTPYDTAASQIECAVQQLINSPQRHKER